MAGVDDLDLSETARRLARFESSIENDKTRLCRALHDDLGGLLVAAAMDTSWAEQQLADNPTARDRLQRIRAEISAAIELERKLIERLRPTLLENFGLIAALRWYHQQNCESANLNCKGAYPTEECNVSFPASQILFRIVEDGDVLDQQLREEADVVSIWLIEHRVRALGGEVNVSHPATGGTVLQALVPWAEINDT